MLRLTIIALVCLCLTLTNVGCSGSSPDEDRVRELEATVGTLQAGGGGSPIPPATDSPGSASSQAVGDDEATVEDVVRQFLEAMAAWDTVQMVNLTCAADREDLESGLQLTQVFFGFAGNIGVNTPRGDLKDLTIKVSLVSADEARVRTTGRMLYGPPLGSVDISDTGTAWRENGAWCVAGDGSDAVLFQHEAGPLDTQVPIVGTTAPDFLLRSLDGNPVRLADLRGKVVWVYFWATWCRNCADEMTAIARVSIEYGDDLAVLAVNYKEPESTIREFVARKTTPFDVLLDSDGRVYDQYRLQGIPDSFFILPDGRLASVHYGSLEESGMRKRLSEAVLPSR